MNKKQPRIKINSSRIDDKIISLAKTRTDIASGMGISGPLFNEYLRKGEMLKKHKIALEKALGKGDWYEKI